MKTQKRLDENKAKAMWLLFWGYIIFLFALYGGAILLVMGIMLCAALCSEG